MIQQKANLNPHNNLKFYLDYFSNLIGISQVKKHALSDGNFFKQVLLLIPNLRIPELEFQPINFIHKFTNIKKIWKSIQEYWEQSLNRNFCYQQIDLISIAKKQSEIQIEKICKVLVQTLFLCENKDYFIEKVLSTEENTQLFLMNLIKKTIERKMKNGNSSPQINKDQKIYEKIYELQHQNQKLQYALQQMYLQSQKFEIRQSHLNQKLNQKELQIKRLNENLCETYGGQYTSRSSVSNSLSDSFVRQSESVQMLKYQLDQVQKDLIKKQASLSEVSQRFNSTNLKLLQFQNLEVTLQNKTKQNQHLNQELIKKQRQLKQLLDLNISRSNDISTLRKSIEAADLKLKSTTQQFSRKLQLKNEKIHQLQLNLQFNSQEQKIQTQKSITNLQLCSLANSRNEQESENDLKRQINNLKHQLNQSYRRQDQLTDQLEKAKIHSVENKKLVDMISHMTRYRGQENQILVSCVYKLRMKIHQLENEKKENFNSSAVREGQNKGFEKRAMAEKNTNLY